MLIPLLFCSLLACVHTAEINTTVATDSTPVQAAQPNSDANSTVSTEATGRRRLKSASYSTYLRAYEDNITVKMVKGPPMLWERWYIDELNGKVILKSFHDKDHFLTAYSNALVGLAGKPRTWEAWTPLKNDDGTWSFQSVHGGWLSVREDGGVRTVEDIEAREQFLLEFWTDSALSTTASDDTTSLSAQVVGNYKIMSVLHGTYLRAYTTVAKVKMVKNPTEELDEWNIEESTDGKVFIHAIKTPNRFLRANTNGTVDAVQRSRKWEEWQPFKNPDGSFSFLSAHGFWLSARADGFVKSVNIRESSEQFWLEPGTAANIVSTTVSTTTGETTTLSTTTEESTTTSTTTTCPKTTCPSCPSTTCPTTTCPTTTCPSIPTTACPTTTCPRTTCPSCPTCPTTTTTESPTTKTFPTASRYVISDVVGTYCLKTCHGSYIRHKKEYTGNNWIVDMGPECNSWWRIKEPYSEKGRVLLHASENSDALLHSYHSVGIEPNLEDPNSASWMPVKNDNGKWSFRNRAGRWLSAHYDRVEITTFSHNDGCEQFELI